jgi:hypothetical protein
LGIFPYPGALEQAAVIFTFGAFFPLLFLVDFAGAIAGAALAERVL